MGNENQHDPHILVNIVDPVQDGMSAAWRLGIYLMLSVEVALVFMFVWEVVGIISMPEEIIGAMTFRLILDSIVWGNVIKCILIIIMFVAFPYIWYTVAGNQKKLDYTIDHTRFKIRTFKGIEKFSKYKTVDPNPGILKRAGRYILTKLHLYTDPVDVIMSFTGIEHFDRTTGLTTEQINEDVWPMGEHPYKGDHAFNVIGTVNMDDDEGAIIENFKEATTTLGANYLVSTSMFSCDNTGYVMDDIEEQLKLPGLSPIRERALWSVYNQFKDREGTDEPVFIIHVGLPPGVHDYEHVENMRKARDEFELTINEMGVDTVLLDDPEDLAMIINGMISGKFRNGCEHNEY